MIGAKIMLADDTEIASVWLRTIPRAGEYLWLTGPAGERSADQFGTTSFVVEEVAHWCTDGWSPSTHTGDPIHTVALYVSPTPKAERQAA